MKHCLAVCLLGLAALAPWPDARAIEVLRWERLPLAVPLVVGQERVVFIDRNVRVGVPAAIGAQLRVQSAGARYISWLMSPSHPADCNCRMRTPVR